MKLRILTFGPNSALAPGVFSYKVLNVQITCMTLEYQAKKCKWFQVGVPTVPVARSKCPSFLVECSPKPGSSRFPKTVIQIKAHHPK